MTRQPADLCGVDMWFTDPLMFLKDC